MWSFGAWRRKRILARADLDPVLWSEALAQLPLSQRLDADARRKLKELVILFLHRKDMIGAGGLDLDEFMRLRVAASLCLPVMNLGWEWCRGWTTVIVYPDEFLTRHRELDEDGIEHDVAESKTGEAWQDGPLILSWADLQDAGEGYNVAIHEMAHKLDMLDGVSDGRPPLHAGMDAQAWAQAFSTAYHDLGECEARGEETAIDPYALQAPEEFFAVASESFFEIPDSLKTAYPGVYAQLRLFYRQDPAVA